VCNSPDEDIERSTVRSVIAALMLGSAFFGIWKMV
jgi:hypothetical protein